MTDWHKRAEERLGRRVERDERGNLLLTMAEIDELTRPRWRWVVFAAPVVGAALAVLVGGGWDE